MRDLTPNVIAHAERTVSRVITDWDPIGEVPPNGATEIVAALVRADLIAPGPDDEDER